MDNNFEGIPTETLIRRRIELSAKLGGIARAIGQLQSAQNLVLGSIYEHNLELHARGIDAIAAMEEAGGTS